MDPEMIMTTSERHDELEARLWAGDRRIQEAEAAGQDVRTWEDFWLQLLQEYEAACRELNSQRSFVGADSACLDASPSRSPAYLAALAALQEANFPCTEHDEPQTLLLALKTMIIAAATADPSLFERACFDRLMGLWETLDAEQVSPSIEH